MKNQLINHKKSRGVTLVELMIAVSIILIAIIPLISMIIQGVQGTQKLSDRTKASQLVQDMIEEIKQKDWDETLIGRTEVGFDTGEDPTGVGRRLDCDDIDDYIAHPVGAGSSIDEHMIENPPVDEGGNPLAPIFNKFVRETSVRYVEVLIDGTEVDFEGDGSGDGTGLNDTTPYKQVDVWVSWNDTGNAGAAAGVVAGVTGDTLWVWEGADNFVHSQTIIARP
ncbi:MAG: prepilin-type N-terminal cleavage/methylation domain-containing protein [Elusimicrobia bacterium]|jgi:hypothetical protein|nr:prepilin-type N-terminal cleavage/methylation domain-containing protein [Elusimicrobiota bacterium]